MSDLTFDAGHTLYFVNEPNDFDDHTLVAAATCENYLARPNLCLNAGEAPINGGSDSRQDQIID